MNPTKQLGAVLGLLASILCAGCNTLDPINEAETLEQKAYALYGTFVIYEETGADLLETGQVPQGLAVAIQQADAIAKPADDTLVQATFAVTEYREEVEALPDGSDTEEALGKLNVALAVLNREYESAKAKIDRLIAAVRDAL